MNNLNKLKNKLFNQITNKKNIYKYFSDSKKIETLLNNNLNNISLLEIKDISGGCGQSFSINIVSTDFSGKSIIQQHRIVNNILKTELNDIHALQLKTSAPI